MDTSYELVVSICIQYMHNIQASKLHTYRYYELVLE